MNSNNTPLVSVVMPSYNGSEYIHAAIASVFRQTYFNMELIIIDDGSFDSTKEIIAFLQKQNSKIRLIENQVNQGIAKTLNRGLEKAHGKYIAILDQDDTWIDQYKLQKQVLFLEQHPEIGFIGTNSIVKNNKEGYYRSSLAQTDKELKEKILGKCPFMHSTLMYRKEIYDSIGGYPEYVKYCSDYAYRLKAGKEFKFANLPDYTLLYTTNSDNVCYAHRTEQAKEAIGLFLRHYKEYPNRMLGIKNIIFDTTSGYLSKNFPQIRKFIRSMVSKPAPVALDFEIESCQNNSIHIEYYSDVLELEGAEANL